MLICMPPGGLRLRMELTTQVAEVLGRKGKRILSVQPKQSVYEAIQKMAEEGVGALLVIEDDRMVGILSERDYARKVILKGRSSMDTQVQEIMTSPVITGAPNYTVDECMTLMTKYSFRHLPICDNDRIVGVVSIGDLVKAIISHQAHAIHELESYIAGKYPA